MGKRVTDSRPDVKKTKEKVAVVTGSNGFIGSSLATVLMETGWKVAGFPRELFLNPEAMTAWFKEVNPSLIVHLAAYGNHSYQADINETMLANVVNTYTLLYATKDIDYECFINVSSSSVYGKKSTSMKETMLPEPLNMYGCSKAAGEYIARAFALDMNKPVVTVRPFSIYGPGEADHRLIPTLLRSFLNNIPMELADGSGHDWVYISDFIDALILIHEKINNVKGTIVNVGTGRQVDNLYVCNVLKGLSGKEGRIRHAGKPRDYDTQLWKADISVLRSFGWSPRISLEHGLWQTFEFYKNKYDPSPLTKFVRETTTVIYE